MKKLAVMLAMGLLGLGWTVTACGEVRPGYAPDARGEVVLTGRQSCHSRHRHGRRDRGHDKLRYTPGHYHKIPGYYAHFGCGTIWVPPRKVWTPGFYH